MEHGGSNALPEQTRYDIAVVEPDPRVRMRLSLQLAGAQQFDAIEDVVQQLRPGRSLVAVFGPGLVGPFGFQQVHRLTTAYPELGAVFVVPELTTDTLQQALRSGARDAVQLEEHGTALAQAVARVGDTLANASNRLPVSSGGRVDPGRLVVVFSPKGGVGKSTVAINVAVCMAQRLDEPVALVDADVQFGDVAVLLGIPPQQTVVDAAAAVHFGDAEMMRTILTRHDSGLLVLPAPAEPSLAPSVAPDELVAVCAALQSQCSHVIVDLPTTFDDLTFALIEAADDVLLVGSMDIPSVKNLKIGMQALDLVTVAGPKLKLVLNRANTRGEARCARDRAGARHPGGLPDPVGHRCPPVGQRRSSGRALRAAVRRGPGARPGRGVAARQPRRGRDGRWWRAASPHAAEEEVTSR